jgi:hypothetical protein
LEQFSKIGQGIETGITQNEKQFKETVRQQSVHFDATMAKEQANIDAVTGGNSYVVAIPSLTDEHTLVLDLIVCFKCKDSVPNARVSLQSNIASNANIASNDLGSLVYSGAIDPNFALTTDTTITPALTGETDYRISVMARNKPTFEMLRVRFNAQSQSWECSWHIEREEVRPHFNLQTQMAEGQVLKVLEDQPWSRVLTKTQINPEKRTIVH